MHKTTLFMLAVFVVAFTGVACAVPVDYDSNIRNAVKLPSGWFKCGITSDCDLAPVPCQLSLAINKTHKTDAHQAICAVFDCKSGCDAAMNDNSYPVCEQASCVTRTP